MDFGWGLTSPQLALRRFRSDATSLICRRGLVVSSPLGRSTEPASAGWAGSCCLESPPCKLAPSASWWMFPWISARMPISQRVSGCPSLSSERLSLIRTFHTPSGLRLRITVIVANRTSLLFWSYVRSYHSILSDMTRVTHLGDDGPEIVFVGIHLYSSAEERLAQAQRIIEIFQNEVFSRNPLDP